MPIKVDARTKEAIENGSLEYTLNGDIGGIRRQRYFTPDGRVILAVPHMVERTIKRNGEIVSQGVIDTNLDKGWLLQPPTKKQLFCRWCDGWHKTETLIAKCKKAFDAKSSQAEEAAKREFSQEAQAQQIIIANQAKKIDDLSKEMTELKEMMKQLMGKG